jgi:hypothetical protein
MKYMNSYECSGEEHQSDQHPPIFVVYNNCNPCQKPGHKSISFFVLAESPHEAQHSLVDGIHAGDEEGKADRIKVFIYAYPIGNGKDLFMKI